MLIFIAGIHGVGKGYLCERYILNNDFLHKSASQLIRENGNITLSSDKLTTDIERNQAILISALDKMRENDENLLLDGHFSLIGENGSVNLLPCEIFKLMKIDAVILIENDKDLIEKRILDRDGSKPLYDIMNFMTSERNNAISICNKLEIPLKTLTAPNLNEFDEAIKEIRRRK
ncbi:AAA family ATPase [Pantoea dispersa]|uniref:ATP-binding protein n=1 Tax=Pantoea dispersa TaxID=59814 RepID=UPI0035289F93